MLHINVYVKKLLQRLQLHRSKDRRVSCYQGKDLVASVIYQLPKLLKILRGIEGKY